MARINLIGWQNQAGLSRDLAVVARTLSGAGHEVEVHGWTPPRRPVRGWMRLRARGRPWDLAIFLERAVGAWMELARRSVLIPNPEWFVGAPEGLSAIWCKSRDALDRLQSTGLALEYLGFSSPSSPNPAPGPRQWRRALHVAGRSRTKGTVPLLEVWSRHPDWPELVVVAETERVPLPNLPPNVSLLDRFVDEETIARLQQECGLHLLPTEVEGFGHTLVEGTRSGAVVLTTDAPPMNEIVTGDRGVVVAWHRTAEMRRGRRFEVDPDALEQAILDLLGWPEDRLREVGRRAQAWYQSNHQQFEQRLIQLVERTLASDRS